MAQVFSCEFCEISKNTFFHSTPLVAASVVYNGIIRKRLNELGFPNIVSLENQRLKFAEYVYYEKNCYHCHSLKVQLCKFKKH